MSHWRKVGHGVSRICGHRNRIGKAGFLPAGSTLTGEGHSTEKGSAAGPQVAQMSASVCGSLVEPDPQNFTVCICAKLHANFDGSSIAAVDASWYGRCGPDGAWADLGYYIYNRSSVWRFQVAAIVNCAAQQRGRAYRSRRPRVSPVGASHCGVPG